jgi:two-component system CheB/CheR fusion protein
MQPPESASGALPQQPAGVVALGASAGGVEALKAFFAGVPASTGLAYVVLLHMARDAHSHLGDVLQTCTGHPVVTVDAPMPLVADRVYVQSPGTTLGISGGSLVIAPDPHHLPSSVIDQFFISLAHDQAERAIGVVLSGHGADGAAGLVALHRSGGLCLVQDPASARHPSMPEHAIATGVADQVMAPEAMGHWLATLPRWHTSEPKADDDSLDAAALQPIFDQLLKGTGHDFSAYKPSTLTRRIRRRMGLSGTDSLDRYIARLSSDRQEIGRLFDDLLINVTRFFRDPATFDVLRDEILPPLLERTDIRIWVPACSTGEEVYSLAILLHSLMESRGRFVPVRIFGTDIDRDAVTRARAGVFSDTSLRHVPAAYRQRYFSRADGSVRIASCIRQMCVFAEQDLIRDPPFSRLDMICCRNVLIYMDTPLQERVFAIFQFALRPGGVLVLGAAESNIHGSEKFTHVNLKHKIYTRKLLQASMPLLGTRHLRESTTPHPPEESPPMNVTPQQEAERYLLARYAPSSVIVDAQLNITGFFGDVAAFMQPVPGVASFRLIKMARPELVGPLTELIDRCVAHQTSEQLPALPYDMNGRTVMLQIRAVPLSGGNQGEFLVIFEASEGTGYVADATLQAPQADAQTLDSRTIELEAQVRFLRDEVRRLRTEQVSAGEELQAANEEIQSTNEELQSTNEELESAKEELQSTNEELTAVNAGLSSEVVSLKNIRDDLLDMLASLDMPLVLLSADLRILRFTPAARPLLNVIDGDVGRPLSHLRPNVELPGLEALCADVLASHAPQTIECRTTEGRWYSLTVRPHVSGHGAVAGILLVFVNLSGMRLSPGYSRWFSQISRDSEDIVNLIDETGTFITWSEKAESRYGYTEIDALRMRIQDMMPADQHADMDALLQSARQRHLSIPMRQSRITKSGEHTTVVTQLTAMYDQRGNLYAFVLTDSATDTWTRHLEDMRQMMAVFDTLDDALVIMSPAGDVLFWTDAAERLYGRTMTDMLGQSVSRYWAVPCAPILDHWLSSVKTSTSGHFSARRISGTGEEINVTGDYFVLHRDGQPVLLATIEKKA